MPRTSLCLDLVAALWLVLCCRAGLIPRRGGVPPGSVIADFVSWDTVGNAWFARLAVEALLDIAFRQGETPDELHAVRPQPLRPQLLGELGAVVPSLPPRSPAPCSEFGSCFRHRLAPVHRCPSWSLSLSFSLDDSCWSDFRYLLRRSGRASPCFPNPGEG